ERDFVVHVVALAAAGHRRLALARNAGRAKVAALARIASTAATSAAVEHGQRRTEALEHHFGGVFLHAVLVGVFPSLKLALDINLRALLQILLGDPAQTFIEDHHPVPLGLFAALARV